MVSVAKNLIKFLQRLGHSDTTRQVLFYSMPFAIFLFWSWTLLVENKASDFSRLGSLVTAWAIINLSVRREQYAEAVSNWGTNRTLKHLNQIRELDEMREESLHLTFDLHATQIVQICHRLGLPNAFVENEAEKIRSFCDNVQERLTKGDAPQRSTMAIEKLREFEASYNARVPTYERWRKITWRLEITLIILGTVQWGYGDIFVSWYHSN